MTGSTATCRTTPTSCALRTARNREGVLATRARSIPDFDDPHAVQPAQQAGARVGARVPGAQARRSPELAGGDDAARTRPGRPARLMVDTDYCVLDALLRDNVTLVTDGIQPDHRDRHRDDRRDAARGRRHRLRDRLPRHRLPVPDDGHRPRGAGRSRSCGEGRRRRAYRFCMMPGFPNLWSIYGPNTNGGLGPGAVPRARDRATRSSAWSADPRATGRRSSRPRRPTGATTRTSTSATRARSGATRAPTTTTGPSTAARP